MAESRAPLQGPRADAPTPHHDRRAVGVEGEEIAKQWLDELEWTVLARNVYVRGGELDLIGIEGDVLVFVEVRSRRTRSGPTASESVTWRKQHLVVKAAQRWLYAHPEYRNRRCRFDVIAVDLCRGRVISHHRGAFEAPPDRASY